MSDLTNKLWSFCHTLRHDGVDYGDYIEQLTYLLFLKMADERGRSLTAVSYRTESGSKQTLDASWAGLLKRNGTDLLDHLTRILNVLSRQPGIFGDMFAQAALRLNNPVNLKKLLLLVNGQQWTALDADVKGQAFEGLLERAASEGKKGAGQYFTPRPLIQTICRVMQPDPRAASDFKICDPACGTGGFLVAAWEWLMEACGGHLKGSSAARIRSKTYYGQDLVPRPRRLALMNLFLHGIEPVIHLGDTIYEPDRGERFDCILSNPPFGTRGASQQPARADFPVATSNKQLNFLQHIHTILKPGGRAAVVLPDNCLFEERAAEVISMLMAGCDVHTILRLPRGTFTPYSQGVKANVLFFTKGRPTAATWIFDARANVEGITKKDRPLAASHFADFEKCFGSSPDGVSPRKDTGATGRFRRFPLSEIRSRGYKLDITWLKEASGDSYSSGKSSADILRDIIASVDSLALSLRESLRLLEPKSALPAPKSTPRRRVSRS